MSGSANRSSRTRFKVVTGVGGVPTRFFEEESSEERHSLEQTAKEMCATQSNCVAHESGSGAPDPEAYMKSSSREAMDAVQATLQSQSQHQKLGVRSRYRLQMQEELMREELGRETEDTKWKTFRRLDNESNDIYCSTYKATIGQRKSTVPDPLSPANVPTSIDYAHDPAISIYTEAQRGAGLGAVHFQQSMSTSGVTPFGRDTSFSEPVDTYWKQQTRQV